MNLQLGLRTAALLVIVAASTAVLVEPKLIKGSSAAAAHPLESMLIVGH